MILKTEIIKDIRQGFETAYINGTLASNLEYKPSFVSNNPKEGKKVISTIEEELLRCEHFQISVAFITMGGIPSFEKYTLKPIHLLSISMDMIM